MDRTDCAILVNTCPKFFYLLEGYFGMLRRYAKDLKWPVYLATEYPKDYTIELVSRKYDIRIIELTDSQADFFGSRVVALKMLPPEIRYVLPLQDDFLLERPGPDYNALKNALEILDADKNVLSLRLMPCPGSSAREGYWGVWKKLLPEDLQFSYQATIWRREVFTHYFINLIVQAKSLYPDLSGAAWNNYCIRTNPAETHPGLYLLKSLFPNGIHLCWPRVGSFANAVYLCPWPYRPTAVVRGKLEGWAEELIRREGFRLNVPESHQKPPKDS
jgi:hypothetical protein